MIKQFLFFLIMVFAIVSASSQALRIPEFKNFKSSVGRELATTLIEVQYSAPQLKGRVGKVFGTDVAWFGTRVLGFGSDVQSPWRAGADEATTISFSTDVMVNGQLLKAGNYSLFMELQAEMTTIIFNSNTREWGSYFYDKSKDVLRVQAMNNKQAPLTEVLNYTFDDQTDSSVVLNMRWDTWAIPMTISVNPGRNVYAYIQQEMTSELGFDQPSLKQAARWCLNNKMELDQALLWLDRATNPYFGGKEDFESLDLRAELLTQLNKKDDAQKARNNAIEIATPIDLHVYARRLGNQGQKEEAIRLFEKNYNKHHGAWPTKVGMMRACSFKGELKKALEWGKSALPEAPDEVNKRALEAAIKTLSEGKSL